MKSSTRSSPSSNAKDACRILPSRYGLVWMTHISKPSRRRSSRHSNSPRMKMAESSCGLGTLGKPPPSSLNLLSHHNHLLPKHSIPHWLNPALLHLLPTRNDGNSPSCFVTWSIL